MCSCDFICDFVRQHTCMLLVAGSWNVAASSNSLQTLHACIHISVLYPVPLLSIIHFAISCKRYIYIYTFFRIEIHSSHTISVHCTRFNFAFNFLQRGYDLSNHSPALNLLRVGFRIASALSLSIAGTNVNTVYSIEFLFDILFTSRRNSIYSLDLSHLFMFSSLRKYLYCSI